ncbi:MAG: YdcH family protein [Deltaproteobacteria bacterium]|nr:YdcH family protein [Deltaproteobacteria bacterium]
MEGHHHHDLGSEFPEYRDKIHYLKQSDAHFKKLSLQYEAVDKSIARIESRIELVDQMEEEKLRKERLQLKDKIYAYLLK